MSATPPPDLPKKRRWNRWLWIPLALLGAIALFVGGLVLVIGGDEPAPNVADLVYTPPVLKPEENAFEVLKAAAAKLDASPWQADQELFDEMTKGKSWDAARAAQWLAANARVWPEVERAAALRQSQAPLLKSLSDTVPEIGPMRQLAYLAQVRAWSLNKEGKSDEAYAWLITNLRVAQRIEEAHSTLILWLTGVALHGISRQTIETMALATPPSAPRAQELMRALEETRPTVEGLAAPIRNERLILPMMFEAMRREPSAYVDGIYARWRFDFLLKPHRTTRLHAEYLRSVLGLIEADWPTVRAATPTADAYVGHGWQRWNPDNAVGRMLLSVAMPTLHTLLEKKLRAESQISAMEALIAVRSFEVEQGRLPGKLSDLVPRYLAQVPRDYYDRNEIRYSPELRAIWSVGKNNLVTPMSTSHQPAAGEICIRLGTKAP